MVTHSPTPRLILMKCIFAIHRWSRVSKHETQFSSSLCAEHDNALRSQAGKTVRKWHVERHVYGQNRELGQRGKLIVFYRGQLPFQTFGRCVWLWGSYKVGVQTNQKSTRTVSRGVYILSVAPSKTVSVGRAKLQGRFH